MPTCIYCPLPADSDEHWLPRGFGAIRGVELLKQRLCKRCNNELGHELDQEVLRTGPSGVLKAVLGIQGRHKNAVNPFHYKVLGPESPTTMTMPLEDGREILCQQHRLPNGEMRVRPLRQLVFEQSDGTMVCVPFPPGYNGERLKALLGERGVLEASLREIYLDPGESHEDQQILDTIRTAARTPFSAEVFSEGTDGSRREVSTTYGISRLYIRGIAKIAFHYYLTISGIDRGDELAFAPLRNFIRNDQGDWRLFVKLDIPHFIGQFTQGYAPESFGHYICVRVLGGEIVVAIQLFAGPSHVMPPAGVRLGPPNHPVPETLHWVRYFDQRSDGYAGELTDLLADGFVERRLRRTGLSCQACKAPAAIIEHQTRDSISLRCPACGHRWSWEKPGATAQCPTQQTSL